MISPGNASAKPVTGRYKANRGTDLTRQSWQPHGETFSANKIAPDFTPAVAIFKIT
jgi:hypothetical protein